MRSQYADRRSALSPPAYFLGINASHPTAVRQGTWYYYACRCWSQMFDVSCASISVLASSLMYIPCSNVSCVCTQWVRLSCWGIRGDIDREVAHTTYQVVYDMKTPTSIMAI